MIHYQIKMSYYSNHYKKLNYGWRIMDKTITESILESASTVLSQMVGMNFKTGEITYEKTPFNGQNLLILVGITGRIHGNAVISFSNSLACKFAGTMMMPDITEIDDFAQSAICELCNMIMGNTATALSQRSVIIDITPPTVLTGQNLEVHVEQTKNINIPLIFDGNDVLNITVSYKE